MSIRTLIIDDDWEIRDILTEYLSDESFTIWEAQTPEEAFKLLENEEVDLIISDLVLPFTLSRDFFNYPYSSEVGVRTIQELGWVYPELPIIAISAAPKSEIIKARERLGDIPVLQKPFSRELLLETITYVMSFNYSEIVMQ
ncbi:MAG: response regulator [Candidatus Dadabacteria bacterium]|nr:MAG: response regulator [Candidatus Dadabacteria bacterium]